MKLTLLNRAKTMTKKGKKENVIIYTPVGVLAWPYLHAPDTGREYSDSKYKGDLFIPKDVWVKEGKPIVDAVLKVAAKAYENPKIKLTDFKHPITDMDKEKEQKPYEKGCIRIRAKSQFQPVIIGPKKDASGAFPKLTSEQIEKIKAGDNVRFICAVYYYPQQGGGVAFGLNFVQFGFEGAAIGQGNLKAIESLNEIEVELDILSEMVDTEEKDPLLSFA